MVGDSGSSGEVQWNGADESGRRVATGSYLAILADEAGSIARTVLVLQ